MLCLGSLADSKEKRVQAGCVEGPGSRQRGAGEEPGFLLGVQARGWVFLFFCNDGAGG